MPNLYEIIYVSRRSPGVTNEDVVDAIVLPSARKNRVLDITGCLWFDHERFLQVLEGPRDAVEHVYDAIQRDTRHHGVETISSSPLAVRSFTRWGMRALTGDRSETIDELAAHFAHNQSRPDAHDPEEHDEGSLGFIMRIRARLVRLAGVEPPVVG